MGSGQVAADTITSVAGSTGTGITMTMVITLNQQPATSYQQPATTPSNTRDGRAGRRNNKIKLVGKVSQITVKRVGYCCWCWCICLLLTMTDIGRVVRLAAERRSSVQLRILLGGAAQPPPTSLHSWDTELRPVPGRPPHTPHVCPQYTSTSALTTAALSIGFHNHREGPY